MVPGTDVVFYSSDGKVKTRTQYAMISLVSDDGLNSFGLFGERDLAFGTVTSVGATVPAFLSIAGSPITSSGTLAITLSGTPLPIANGGTGTATPALVAGSQIAITGSWPNQTIAVTPAIAWASLIDGATINTDASTGNNFKVTLGGNRTLANPTNLTSGTVINYRFKQDGTGNRTLAYGSKFKFPGGTAPVLSTAIDSVDLMVCIYEPTDDILMCNMLKAFA
jgi:hypothetical protein